MNIRYKGLSLARDEHNVETGELSLCANVELNNGAIRPSILQGSYYTSQDFYNKKGNSNVKLIYAHPLDKLYNFFGIAEDGEICTYESDGSYLPYEDTLYLAKKEEVVSMSNIGNTVVLCTTKSVYYFLWKADPYYCYKYLGTKPPFIEMQFSVKHVNRTDFTRFNSEDDTEEEAKTLFGAQALKFSSVKDFIEEEKTDGKTTYTLKDDTRSYLTESIEAVLNRTNSYVTEDNYFYANFYVRYCVRLYDGTMTYHSAPVFIPLNTSGNFLVSVMPKGNKSISKVHFTNMALIYTPIEAILTYRIANNINTIKEDWSDIISSVDIFVSTPILRYRSGELLDKTVFNLQGIHAQKDILAYLGNKRTGYSLNHKSLQNEDHAVGADSIYSSDIVLPPSFFYSAANGYDVDTQTRSNYIFNLPTITDEEYNEKVMHPNVFFKIASISLKQLSANTKFTAVTLKKGVLSTLTSQEQMKDDYNSHNEVVASYSFTYNKRLNLVVEKEKLYKGFPLHTMLPCGPLKCSTVGTEPTTLHKDNLIDKTNVIYDITDIETHITTQQGERAVRVVNKYTFDLTLLEYCPLFYPNSKAFYIRLLNEDDSSEAAATLIPSINLNSAVVNMTGGQFFLHSMKDDTLAVNENVSIGNKIYTSEVNNPFFFPLEGMNTIGNGIINGIATATRAVSTGQFGQFPLIAFCSDGIYALSVASTGTYSAVNPISRVVCENKKSITQIDQSIVFFANQQINKIASSDVVPFSDVLQGVPFDIVEKLFSLSEYFQNDEEITELIKFSKSPIQYFKNGQVLYDAINQRIFVFPERKEKDYETYNTVALIYSIADSSWSTLYTEMPFAIFNAYPYPFIQDCERFIHRLDKLYDYNNSIIKKGLILTRTLNIDGAMKAISGFSQEHNMQTPPLMFFFGSNDNINWKYIGRSARQHADYLPAHSYRFFRIAIYLQMKPNEQYFSTNLNITQKYGKL